MNATLCAVIALACSFVPVGTQATTPKGQPAEEWPTDVPKPEDIQVAGNPQVRYLLHVPDEKPKEPQDGWRVLFVLPGGNGNADFAPFVARILKNALSKDWILAQLVAPKWDEKQGETLVWPTEKNPYAGMKFSTEELFAQVLDDVGKRRKLDPRYVFTLSWSSSGPAAYALALSKKTHVAGSFIAMSVFKPDQLPSLKEASGQAFYILHSPQDAIPIKMAEDARDQLTKNGAKVELATYEGGHGWKGDVYGNIRKGIAWLEDAALKKAKSKVAK
jgi:predicted esterase